MGHVITSTATWPNLVRTEPRLRRLESLAKLATGWHDWPWLIDRLQRLVGPNARREDLRSERAYPTQFSLRENTCFTSPKRFSVEKEAMASLTTSNGFPVSRITVTSIRRDGGTQQRITNYGSSGGSVCCGKDPLKTGAEPSARARQKGPAPTTFAIASTPGNAGRGPMRRRRRKGLREAIFHIFGNPDYQMSYGEHTLLPDEP